MNIKMIATDMDGTLFDSEKRLPKDFFEWVNNHDKVKFVISSGRQYYSLSRAFGPVHDKLIFIAENGAVIYHHDELIHHDEMSIDDAVYCLKLIEKMPNCKALASGIRASYIENPDQFEWDTCARFCGNLINTDNIAEAMKGDMIVKIAILYKNNDAGDHVSDFDVLPKHLKPVLSGESWIDLSMATVSKGTAVKVIQEKCGFDPKYCMAFGDYLNDVDMLEACGESYCMKNGHPDVFKSAKYIADSNDDDGVMKVLRSEKYSF